MSDKTPTERLREGLAERGVEYETNDDYRLPNDLPQTTWTSTIAGDLLTVTASEDNGYLDLDLHELVTPEQAIAATVGGTGEFHTCKRCGIAYEIDFIDEFGKARFCPHCGYRGEVDG